MASEPAKNKISPTIKIVGYVLFTLFPIVYFSYGFLWHFFAPLKVSLGYANNSLVINSLINSSNTYLTLLQEIVISASMIFGFYAVLLFYFVDHITKFINKYTTATDRVYKGFIKLFTFIFILLPFFYIFLSAFYSITATMIYRTPNLAYSTIQAYIYNSVYKLFFGTGIIIANLIVFLVVRFWLSALPKNNHGVTIFIIIWYALLLFIPFTL